MKKQQTYSVLVVSALCVALASLGCSKKEEPAVEKAPVEAAPVAPVAAAPAPAKPLSPDVPTTQLGDVPVSEDLEQEAEKTVFADNLETELDRLEAEIIGRL